jgi:hypothetical protein
MVTLTLLNLVTEMEVYPLPNMLDFVAKAAGRTVFSKIDVRKGYHHIPACQPRGCAINRHGNPLRPV